MGLVQQCQHFVERAGNVVLHSWLHETETRVILNFDNTNLGGSDDGHAYILVRLDDVLFVSLQPASSCSSGNVVAPKRLAWVSVLRIPHDVFMNDRVPKFKSGMRRIVSTNLGHYRRFLVAHPS